MRFYYTYRSGEKLEYEFESISKAITNILYNLDITSIECLEKSIKFIRKLPSNKWSGDIEEFLDNYSSEYKLNKTQKNFWIIRDCFNLKINDLILHAHITRDMNYSQLNDEIIKASIKNILEESEIFNYISE